MKKVVILITLILGIEHCHAQTWEEWFRQRRTQLRYLLTQIEAFKMYAGYAVKGYKIAKEGTDFINQVKHGDFNLHNGYFNSLKTVTTFVKRNSRIPVIISNQADIIRLFKGLMILGNESGQLSSTEMEYIKSVYNNLNAESGKDLDDLYLVITSQQLEMTEGERVKRINELYSKMNDKLSFSKTFCQETLVLIQQKKMAQLEVDKLRKVIATK